MNQREPRQPMSVIVLILIVVAFCGLIMIAIVGILAAIAVPNFLNAQQRAKVSRVQADIRSISTAIGAYEIDNGQFPSSLSGITTPIAYMSSLPGDPFAPPGGSVGYQYMAAGESFVIVSYGPDAILDTPVNPNAATIPSPLLYYDPSNGLTSRGDIIRAGTPVSRRAWKGGPTDPRGP